VSHGGLRDDRFVNPFTSDGGRASKDGLAACRRENAMAHQKPALRELNGQTLSFSSSIQKF